MGRINLEYENPERQPALLVIEYRNHGCKVHLLVIVIAVEIKEGHVTRLQGAGNLLDDRGADPLRCVRN